MLVPSTVSIKFPHTGIQRAEINFDRCIIVSLSYIIMMNWTDVLIKKIARHILMTSHYVQECAGENADMKMHISASGIVNQKCMQIQICKHKKSALF